MLALPVALSQKLIISAELAAIRLKEKVDTELPAWARSALSSREITVFAAIGIDENSEPKELELFLSEPTPPTENALLFSCTVSTDTFERVRSDLTNQVVESWASAAVERRMRLGRELFNYSDEDLGEAIESSGYFHFSMYDHIQIQRYFFGCLARRELEMRKIPCSNHEKLDELKKAEVLRKQLEEEISCAQSWWENRSPAERKSATSYRIEGLPEHEKMVYAYRAYQTNRYGTLLDFNAWGEASRSRKRRAVAKERPAEPFVIGA